MILQGVGVVACLYALNKLYDKDRRDIKKKWIEIMKENNLVNSKGQTFHIAKIEAADYGYVLIVGKPIGFSFEELEKKKAVLESGLKGIVLMDHEQFNGWIKIRLISHPFKDEKFVPIETKPYELYFGYTFYQQMTANMDSLPHVLIAGINGSGKTRGLYTMLTNLVHFNDESKIELYIAQIAKDDLYLFRKCRQVQYYAEDLKQSMLMYEHLFNVMMDRFKLIKKHMDRGIVNIETYNQKMKDKLKYIYVVSDEFSLYMPDKTDSPEEKLAKNKCLDILKKLIKLGRAAGIFLIISLQRTTTDQMPIFLKSQVNVKVCFKQTEPVSSQNIINCDDALKLKRREAVLLADDKYKIMMPYIDDEIIKKYIASSIDKNHRYLDLDKEHEKHVEEDGVIKRGARNVNGKGYRYNKPC